MQAILDVLKAIGDFFSTVINFVVKIVSDLVYVVDLMGKTIAKIPQYLSFLPSSVVAIFVVALTVIVVYKIIGRD